MNNRCNRPSVPDGKADSRGSSNLSSRPSSFSRQGGPETDRPGPFQLRVASDHMKITYEGVIPPGEAGRIAKEVRTGLVEMRVMKPPPVEEIETLLRKNAGDSSEFREIELVRGEVAIQPEDGRLDWAADFFNEGFAVDEITGNIDFREPAAHTSVLEDELLVVAVPPKKGKDGFDVFGKRIPVRTPHAPPIRAGDNVRVDKETGAHYAGTSGRFRWANNIVSVDPIYLIRGNVGPETGNISHPGIVTVMGDVLEGFRLEATGDIEVRGIAEGAQIQTSGELYVKGGMIGAEGQKTVTGGDIRARFIVDCDVVADGNVAAESEIIQSSIVSRGAVSIKRGRIVGGSVMALGGIVAGALGSGAGVPTSVIAGTDYALEGKLLIKNMEIRKLRKMIDSYPGREPKETARMNDRLATMEQEVVEIEKDSVRRKRPVIEVVHAIYPDTTLCIGDLSVTVVEKQIGPLLVRVEDGEIVIAPRKG